MRFNVPKIVRPVALTDYAAELTHDDGSPAVVQVWVNPPAALLTHHRELSQRGATALAALKADGDKAVAVAELNDIGAALSDLFAELWSQHADPETHWTAAEVTELANSDANPALYGWLTRRTLAAIGEYRGVLRKN